MINCVFEGQTNIVHLRHVVVDALIIQGEQILLVKRGQKSYLEIGKWALPGGYLEMDETGEQAILREVKEETGYDCKVIKLIKVNDAPGRPKELNRQNVSLIYLLKPIQKTGDFDQEITEIKWFDFNNLPLPEQFAFDHLETIKLFIQQYDQKTV